MFFSKSKQIIFVAIPKTGTRSVRELFKSSLDGGMIRGHIRNVPKQYQSFYKFTTIRDPYTRTVSAYVSTMFKPRYRKRLGINNSNYISFNKYLDLIKKYPLEKYIWSRSQIGYLSKTKFDKIIKMENLSNELLNIKRMFNVRDGKPIPNQNITADKFPERVKDHFSEFYDEKSLKKVNDMYVTDFEATGYPICTSVEDLSKRTTR
jgi:hypothetical protein